MTVCPIAIVAGCKKCPAFSICPLKGVLGDQPGGGAAGPGAKAAGDKAGAAPRAKK
ncbi:MAG: hypothetical protein KA151_05430 [Piscinibacter sp.]|jgi:hypothetical protein|nr:hypothetical protein [Piscinibacter sp.]